MDIRNKHQLNSLSIALLTGFMEGQAGAAPEKPVAPELLYEDDAYGETEADVPWTSAQPRLKEWLPGEQEMQTLSLNKIVILPGRYSLLMGLDIPTLENDKQAKFVKLAQSNGSETGDFEERSSIDLLNAGADTISSPADGTKKFFDTGRKASILDSDSSTYDNLVAGALDATSFESAVSKLMNMTDGKGTALGYGRRGFNLIVGSANRAVGLRLVEALNLAGGASNVNYKAADLIVSPYVSGTKWFLQAKTAPRAKRPIVKVNFSKMRTRITDENSSEAINNDRILWQVYTRLKFAYGDPQTIIGGPGA